jgi:hypothetical protein
VDRRRGEDFGESEGELEAEDEEKSFLALIRNGGEGSMAGFLIFNFEGEVQIIDS